MLQGCTELSASRAALRAFGSFGSAAMAVDASAMALPYSSSRRYANDRFDNTAGLAGSKSKDLCHRERCSSFFKSLPSSASRRRWRRNKNDIEDTS